MKDHNYLVKTSIGDIDLRIDRFNPKYMNIFNKLSKEDYIKLAQAHKNMEKVLNDASLKGYHSGEAYFYEQQSKNNL